MSKATDNIQNKVLYINHHQERISNPADKEAFDAIKLLTDNFTDLADDLFDEKSIAGIEKLYKVLQSAAPDGEKQRVYFIKPTQDEVLEETKEEEQQEEAQPEVKKQDKPKAEPKKKKEAKPKETFQGDFVRKETVEHVVVKKFLALRKQNAPAELCLNAYVKLQKKLASGELSKANVQHPNLIMSIQGAYYSFLKGKHTSLTLSEEKLIEASNFVSNEKKYGTVRLMSEFVGWTGKSKTIEQLENFIKRANKVISESPKNAPYLEELEKTVKALAKIEPSMSIIPEAIGLEGLGQNFAIHVR